MKKHTPSLLHTRTRLQSGNAASDACYADRNWFTTQCAFEGWPQHSTTPPGPFNTGGVNRCRGNLNETYLMECLSRSGQANWWKDFAGCTSAGQCMEQANVKHNNMIADL